MGNPGWSRLFHPRSDDTIQWPRKYGTAVILLILSWGLMALYGLFGLPDLIDACRARLWVRTPCVIVNPVLVNYSLEGGYRRFSSEAVFRGRKAIRFTSAARTFVTS